MSTTDTEATEDIGLAAPNEPKPCRACDPSVGFICEEHGDSEAEAEDDAYNYACELMEQGWKERAKRGVEIGTEGSLCDGIAWIFDRMKKLEAEAAKATGTAGDLPELPQCFGSIDVYHDSGQVTSVDGWTADQMRGYAIDYAMQLGLAARQPAPVLAVSLTTDQKRELLKCLNGGVEMGWIEQNNALEISSSILAGAQDQKLPVLPVKPWETRMQEYFAQGSVKMRTPASFMADEIIDSRAALAATAAPVLSDEQMDDNDRELLILSIQDLNELASGETGALGTDNLLKPGGMKKATMVDVKRKLPYVVKRLRDLVAKLDGAATNRSQP